MPQIPHESTVTGSNPDKGYSNLDSKPSKETGLNEPHTVLNPSNQQQFTDNISLLNMGQTKPPEQSTPIGVGGLILIAHDHS